MNILWSKNVFSSQKEKNLIQETNTSVSAILAKLILANKEYLLNNIVYNFGLNILSY